MFVFIFFPEFSDLFDSLLFGDKSEELGSAEPGGGG
jgi:hypothetical protein